MNDRSGDDYFSAQSESYFRHRPTYPDELFKYLSSLLPSHKVAWDAGCGNGQASTALATLFEKVYATDNSEAQLSQAKPHPRIEFACVASEQTTLTAGSVELVIAAQAVHWFDVPRFFEEAKRVLRPGGVIAVWSYFLPTVSKEINAFVTANFSRKIEPYWPKQVELVRSCYSRLPWPFTEIEAPHFDIKSLLNREEFLYYLGTWSAAERFRRELGEDPLGDLRAALPQVWPVPEARLEVTSPIYLRVGRT